MNKDLIANLAVKHGIADVPSDRNEMAHARIFDFARDVLRLERNASDLPECVVDAPRGFFMGLELGCKNLEQMRDHLDRCGYDYACWPDWAKTQTGHISKAGKAILIYAMMRAAESESA